MSKQDDYDILVLNNLLGNPRLSRIIRRDGAYKLTEYDKGKRPIEDLKKFVNDNDIQLPPRVFFKIIDKTESTINEKFLGSLKDKYPKLYENYKLLKEPGKAQEITDRFNELHKERIEKLLPVIKFYDENKDVTKLPDDIAEEYLGNKKTEPKPVQSEESTKAQYEVMGKINDAEILKTPEGLAIKIKDKITPINKGDLTYKTKSVFYKNAPKALIENFDIETADGFIKDLLDYSPITMEEIKTEALTIANDNTMAPPAVNAKEEILTSINNIADTTLKNVLSNFIETPEYDALSAEVLEDIKVNIDGFNEGVTLPNEFENYVRTLTNQPETLIETHRETPTEAPIETPIETPMTTESEVNAQAQTESTQQDSTSTSTSIPQQSLTPSVQIQDSKSQLPYIDRYHKTSLKLFFENEVYPKWDNQLEKNILSLKISKDQVIKMMDSVITQYGQKIFVYERKSDTLTELNELIQLQFCIERSLHMGPRVPTATVELSKLNQIKAAAQAQSQPSIESIESSFRPPSDTPIIQTKKEYDFTNYYDKYMESYARGASANRRPVVSFKEDKLIQKETPQSTADKDKPIRKYQYPDVSYE